MIHPDSPTTLTDTLGPPAQLWPAHWIIHASAYQSPTGVYLFRRTFDLRARPATFNVRVTADNRHGLYVNGSLVNRGPARGDLMHWRWDTVDIAPQLTSGRNVIAAVVWYLNPDWAPWAQVGRAPGFLLCGDPADSATQVVNTPNEWRCSRNAAHTFHPEQSDSPFGAVVGATERIEGAAYPWGWEQVRFDDSKWDRPHVMGNGTPRGARDGPGPWNLTPNPLPPMEEASHPVTAVLRSEGVVVENHRLDSPAPVVIPARTKAALLLDNTVLTTGYPELSVRGGRGATVRARYSEALFSGPNRNQKANRSRLEGMSCHGYFDQYHPDGAERTFRPLYWRTFRFLQIEVETADEPLILTSLTNRFTAYPFAEKAHFKASDSSLGKIWDVGWRTARLCAHETYMDCPYYEQLQYGGDTRIQCLVSLYVSGDDRLMRNAIRQLDDSRIPDGITQSRYPCWNTQIIPPFALWWVGMIHDHWMFRGDAAFVKGLLPGVRSTLDWFLSRLGSDGLLGPLPWWNFVDWARVWPSGVPPGANDGGSAILSLQLVLALREAAELEQAGGLVDNANRYRASAKRICESVFRQCFDSRSAVIADTPKKDRFSQHANVLGILTDTLTGKLARSVAELIQRPPKRGSKPGESPDSLAQATFYFRFYLHRALRMAGLANHYLEWIQPWRDMLAIGLTTWAEEPEPTRSDCHAWSAHPNVDLLATVLGVEPAAPGFARVRIAPHLGTLEWAEGSVPHPAGEIEVKLRRSEGNLRGEVTLPAGIEGIFFYKGREQILRSGRQSIAM